MSTISSNLYPPVVPDIASAFVENFCNIYFSIPQYNSETDFQKNCLQITLVNQKTNISALDPNKYPAGVKLASFYLDSSKKGDYNYYTTIYSSDLKDSIFTTNQFYKIQLRFTATGVNVPETATERWLSENKNLFSEWSKVCLIKQIEKPRIIINGFNNETQNGNEKVTLTNPTLDIIGRLQTNGEEYLQSYNIKVYNSNDLTTPIYQSGEIYTNSYNPNEFYYEGNYELVDGEEYTLKFTYVTNNLYTESIKYNFIIVQQGIDKIDANIYATPEEDKGRIKIQILSDDLSNKIFIGNLVIRRTSSKSNFHRWEDVNVVPYVTESKIDYTWYDRTVESGVWYKYCAQKQNSRGYRGAIIQIDQPVMCLFDDIFITTGDKQLKIMFNPSLSEFKYNVTESQQTTIGAKYPYINRNSANYFRSFPIGGLISSFVDTTDWYDPHFQDGEFKNNKDELGLFTTKSEIYGSNKQLYNNYNQNHGITSYNDYIYEKEFRQKVYDFLYKHDVKLFRSTTEGNILIKLMNIDFQPVESLGRRLYSFTANAVEVDAATIKNYDKYNIQKIGKYSQYINYKHKKMGQISTYFSSKENVIQSIIYKYQKSTNAGFINQIEGLTKVKIEIESPPYLIAEQDGQLIRITEPSNFTNVISGYIIQINEKDFIIRPSTERILQKDGKIKIVHIGFFESKDDNILIKSLSFKYPVFASVDYIVSLNEIEDTSSLIERYYTSLRPGQLFGTFSPQDMLVQKIYNKYYIKNDVYYQKLLNISGIEIQSMPGAIIYIKDSKDSNFDKHILENGYLQLMDSEVDIRGLYFCGIHLYDGEFTQIEGEYESFSDIQNPVSNGIYQISQVAAKNTINYNRITGMLITNESEVLKKSDKNYSLILKEMYEDAGNYYIYYNNNWYPITSDHNVLCPIEGIVNYFCEVERGEYI